MQESVIQFEPSKEYYFDEGCHIIEQLNSKESPNTSIARARVVAGTTTQWHQLNGITEHYYILEGIGLVEVGNTIKQLVTPGDIVVIPSNCRQRIHNTGNSDLIFLAICSPRFTPDKYSTA